MALKPSPTPPTQTTTANLSPEQTQLMQLALPGVKQFAANVPQRYQGEQVAGFTPDQLAAFRLARSGAGTSGALAGAGAGALYDLLQGGGGGARESTRGDFTDTRPPEERGGGAPIGPAGVPLPQFAPRPEAVPRPDIAPAAQFTPQQTQQPFGQNFFDPGSNPILQSAIGAATRPITENLRENILPGIRSDAIQTGGFGGSRQGISEGMASREAERAIGDTAAKLAQSTYGTNVGALGQQYGTDVGAATQRYGTDVGAATQRYGTDVGAGVNLYGTDMKNAADLYGQDNANQLNLYKTNVDAALRGNQLQADTMLRSLGLLPSIQQTQLSPAQTFGTIGDVQQQQMQRYINENMGNFNYDQMAPFLQSKEIMSLMAGLPGGSSTTVGNLNPQNPFLAGLGGAATGASLGSMFGPMGAGIGGLGGGLLGFLGTPK